MLTVVFLLPINLKNDRAQVSGCFLQGFFLVEVVDEDVAEITLPNHAASARISCGLISCNAHNISKLNK